MQIHKKYRLVKEHENHFEIHDTTDGKRFPIAKKDLHPASQIKLMKMPMFAEGGEVEDEDAVDQSPAEEQPSEDANEVAQAEAPVNEASPSPVDVAAITPQFAPQEAVPLAPPSLEVAPPPTPAQAPPINSEDSPPGMKEMESGIRGQAASANQLAKDQQAAIVQHQKEMDAFKVDHANAVAKLDLEQSHYQQQLAEGKINPNRYFENMSTGKRVATAISLILGGIGAGLTKGPNVAMQVMNKAVDDDIAAQKADIGKNQNLLSFNLQKYHRLDMAEAATRLQYNTNLQMQLQAAQSKATNGVAQSVLHLQMGKLQQEAYQLKYTMALNMAKGKVLGAGSVEGGLPEGQEPLALLSDPKYQEKRVIVNGRAYQAADKADAEKMRRTESIAGPVSKQIQELQSLSKDPSTKFAGTPSNQRAHSIMGNLAVQLPQLTGLTRVNEVEINHLITSFQDPTRFDQALGSSKNTQFLKTMEEELESKRGASLIGYKGGASSIKPVETSNGMLPMNFKKKK